MSASKAACVAAFSANATIIHIIRHMQNNKVKDSWGFSVLRHSGQTFVCFGDYGEHFVVCVKEVSYGVVLGPKPLLCTDIDFLDTVRRDLFISYLRSLRSGCVRNDGLTVRVYHA